MNSLAKEYGIPVIDDCIEAFGSELNGKKAGNLGTDVSVFSFKPFDFLIQSMEGH